MIRFHCHAHYGKDRGEVTVGRGYVAFSGVLMTAQLTRETKEEELVLETADIRDVEVDGHDVIVRMKDDSEHVFTPQYRENEAWSADALATAIRAGMAG